MDVPSNPVVLTALFLACSLPSMAPAQTCLTSTPTPQAETWKSSVKVVKGAKITLFTGPTDHGSGLSIASGIGKDLWVTLSADAAIMKITTTGAAHIYPTPTTNSKPEAITQSGNEMWFTEWGTGCVGSITAAGKLTEFPTGLSMNMSTGMAAGTSGQSWFVTDLDGIGRITSAGKVHLFKLPDNQSQPSAITLGPDGNMWFIEFSGSNVGKITPNGVVTEYDAGLGGFSNSFGITSGPDGRIWFADPGNSIPRIGAINTDGTELTYYSTGLTGQADSIVAGPDGNLYFGEFGGVVGRITTAGKITEFPLPQSEGSFPILGLTVGPNGNIWFSNNDHSQIGELTLPAK